MGEAELITRSQRGDTGAFNQLVLAYQEAIFNVALRILGDQEAAADATQDAFLSAFQGIRSFRGGSFKVWLMRIVTNACYDQMRSRQRHPTASLDAMLAADDNGSSSPGSLPSPDESPEDRALRREVQTEVQRGLLLLPPDQRIAVVLSDVHGLSYEEIAAVTRTNVGTVKSRLSRGRGRLRDHLRQRELLPSVVRL